MKILMTGGGTLGPVTPLIAIADAMAELDPWGKVVWVGTPQGPEGDLLEKLGYRFYSLHTAKLPRHLSPQLVTAPFVLGRSYFQARQILKQEKPDLVMSAGGYVSVPLIWAAWSMKIPTWIHQLDVRPGLANKMMAPAANKITTSWKQSVKDYPEKKTKWIGNPVRDNLKDVKREEARQDFGIDNKQPTVLVLGGGTGATWINEVMKKVGPDLIKKANVIHQIGKGKEDPELYTIGSQYKVLEFIYDMDKAYAAADLVVCRAGMGTISELAFLSKPAVLIPIPHNQQEDNTAVLSKKRAAIVFKQSQSTEELEQVILELLEESKQRKQLGQNLHELLPTEGVAEKIAQEIKKP
jgi:UDP-N-acetylglucosamine--N-acetylmuramyl-(pentapeptide) pyrophosphoryl-undecaprenol N-acetylglucosamine transferase